MLFLIVGVMGYQWYITEIAALFLAMGLVAGASFGYDADKITQLFLEGAKDIMSAALVVGLAGDIIVILEEGKIVHTILHCLAQSMSDFGKYCIGEYHVRYSNLDQYFYSKWFGQGGIDHAHYGTFQ